MTGVATLAFVVVAGYELDDHLSREGYSMLDEIRLWKAGGQCVYAGRTDNLRTEAQKKLHGLFWEAGLSPTGDHILQTARDNGTFVCYDPKLNEPNSCGFVTIGRNYVGRNHITLNPSSRYRKRTINTLVHEIRHRQQDDMGFSNNGNFKESDIMIRHWLKEADARLSSLVFAYEMQQQGHDEQQKILNGTKGYSHMMTAFVESLQAGEGTAEAMRSAIRVFRDNELLARNYDNSILSYLEQANYRFDPEKPEDVLLTDEALMQLGQIGDYPNYMNEELMGFIRSSITYDYFESLSALRKEAGGSKGAVCGKKEEKSKPAPTPNATPVS